MSTLSEGTDAASTQHLQQQNEDQEPLIGQQPGYRTSEDEDITAPASTSESVWQKAFLLIWDSGLACIAVASLCSSIGALCIKLLDGRIPVFEIVMVRSTISWAVTDALGRAQHITPLYGSRKRYPILALRGTMGAIAMALYYEAFERLMLSEAMTLYFIYPAITVVMAWLVHGEAATWVSAAGCGISLLGVAFIARPPFLFGGAVQYGVQHWLGVASAFGSAFSAAAAMVAVRAIKQSEASLTVALWFHSLAVVGAILPLSLGYPSPPVLPTFKEWVPLLAIAACSCVNQVCLNRGFQLEVAAKASAVNYTQVLWAHIWGIAFLGETEQWSGITGTILLAGGVVTVSSYKSKPTGLGPDDTTAFVTSVESKAPDYEDTRITLGDGFDTSNDKWQDPAPEVGKQEIEMSEEASKH